MRSSISFLPWVSSYETRRTLLSSCSSVPFASDKATSNTNYSASIFLHILSISWIDFPPTVILSIISFISFESALFSLQTLVWKVPQKHCEFHSEQHEVPLTVHQLCASRLFNDILKILNYSMSARPESSLVMAWRGQLHEAVYPFLLQYDHNALLCSPLWSSRIRLDQAWHSCM